VIFSPRFTPNLPPRLRGFPGCIHASVVEGNDALSSNFLDLQLEDPLGFLSSNNSMMGGGPGGIGGPGSDPAAFGGPPNAKRARWEGAPGSQAATMGGHGTHMPMDQKLAFKRNPNNYSVVNGTNNEHLKNKPLSFFTAQLSWRRKGERKKSC
jgi:hypothetical protein